MLAFRLRPVSRSLFVGLTAVLLLSACGGGGSSAPAPNTFNVIEGDQQATLTWNDDTSVQYWLFYAPNASFTTVAEWSKLSGAKQLVGGSGKGIHSPTVVTGLTNGTPYYFAMNARKDGGEGGPLTAVIKIIPRVSGNTWLNGDTMSSATTMRGIAQGTDSNDSTSVYVAVGDAGQVMQAPAYISTAKLAWTAKATLGKQLNSVIYALGKFITVGADGYTAYATTPATWTAGTSSDSGTTNLNSVASNGSTVVAVGDNGRILTSTDGQSWTPATAVPAGTPNLYGVTYSTNGTWVAVGASCQVLTSTDAQTWTAKTITASGSGCTDLRSVATVAVTTNNVTSYSFAAVGTGSSGGAIVTSSDGSTWTQLTDVGTAALYAVTPSADGRFAAVGAGGAIFLASSLNTWAAPTTASPTSATLYGLTRGNAIYTAVGSGGANIYSY